MSMNPPAPEPTRAEKIAKTTGRLADRYALVLLAVVLIVVGFILGRV